MPTNEVSDPVVLVSADTHVGPLLVEQLRDYCPEQYLEDFDAFASLIPADRLTTMTSDADYYRWNNRSAGHHDVHARLADMDRDGVACGAIFHNSTNGEPFPFIAPGNTFRKAVPSAEDAELRMAGMKIYNRWLADFCSVEPARHVGLCYLPMWDMEASLDEVAWAHEHGLRGVNFPAPTTEYPPYDDPAWEPFFATCAERNMVLNTHIGGGEFRLYDEYQGASWMGAFMMENPWLGRRAMWLMTFSGVFDRHPNLKLAFVELPGNWWSLTVQDMDAAYYAKRAAPIRALLKKLPSEYVATNLFMGASFQSRAEAEMAVIDGCDDRFMWGSDYPHVEGTWMYTENPDDPPVTRLSLANTFHDLPERSVRNMAGENAMRCYDLDRDALAAVAARIGPDITELLSEPDLALVPERYVGSGFRTHGSFS